MSISDPNRSGSSGNNYTTTRRGLVAAAAVFGAMMVGQVKAHAMALPPFWKKDRGGSGPSCFLRGTRILTPKGEVRIEDLAVGDLVTTIDGSAKPITWVGHWSYPRASTGKWPEEALPVKFVRSALAPLVPHTDLYLSQEHSLYFDGLLIPARRLVNGRSILLCKAVETDTIDYFHIRLAEQDIIFSEGAHSETMVPTASYDEVSNLPDTLISRASLNSHSPAKLGPGLPSNRMAIFRSRVRSAVSPWIDRRRPGDAVWEKLAERAESQISL